MDEVGRLYVADEHGCGPVHNCLTSHTTTSSPTPPTSCSASLTPPMLCASLGSNLSPRRAVSTDTSAPTRDVSRRAYRDRLRLV